MLLRALTWKTCLVYLDNNIMVMGKTFKEQLANLQEVFSRMNEENLELNSKKCLLFQKVVEFLFRQTGSKLPQWRSMEFAIGQDQEIITKSRVSWDCVRITEALLTGLLILLLLCTDWCIWSLSLIGLLNVRQPSKDWRMPLILLYPMRSHRECLSWTQTRATMSQGRKSHRVLQQLYFQNPRRTTVLRGRSCWRL